MKLLNPNDYRKLNQPLEIVQINNLFARAVIERKTDGIVYVDNPDNPVTYYIKHPYGMSLLFGETNNLEFNESLAAYLLNKSVERETPEFMQVFPNAWSKKLDELLGPNLVQNQINGFDKSIIQLGRINFRFNYKNFSDIRTETYPDVIVERTSETMFDKIHGVVVPSKFWRNSGEFYRDAVGFSALVDGKPVSTAFASFLHEPYLELGIETHPDYRGKGLAFIVCSELIAYCLQKGYEPVWACRADNTGSITLAQKLGFEIVRELPYYQLPVNRQ